MSDIKQEFEKAFYEKFTGTNNERHAALWAAKWMAERCANYIEHESLPDAYSEPCLEEFAKEIRQMAKEL